ncbi:cold shock small protein YmcF [Paramixta manurensis]|uniref:cold shock small protein YmcF n=1 Tax=Paramixta manurensis TaxID=2740817 RepID=UPI003F496F70
MKVIILILKFRCPSCSGHQYRRSMTNVTPKNPHGTFCIFCKSTMVVSYKAMDNAI